MEMTYSSKKRALEIRKRLKKEKKAERKRLRKQGLLGVEPVEGAAPPTEPVPPAPTPEEPKKEI